MILPRLTGIETQIAWRYLFAKKSHNAINIISGIAVGGIAVATVAMVVVLSVFNGFHDLLAGLYTEFDPDYKVVPAQGKYFSPTEADTLQARLERCAEVEAVSRVIEDQALILFKGHPEVITVKGVDDQFGKVTNIQSICYGDGQYQLHRADVEYGIPGVGLAQMMGGPQFPHLQICAPRGGERINLMDPLENLSVVELDNTGLVFSVNQRKYDDQYMLISLQLAQQLFEKEGQCTALEVKTKTPLSPSGSSPLLRGSDTQVGPQSEGTQVGSQSEDTHIWPFFKGSVQDKLQEAVSLPLKRGEVSPQGTEGGLRGSAIVLNRMQQQESIFSIMQIEKLLAYVFLTFILLVACFNIISSVSMLIIEKQHDAQTLSHMGLAPSRVRRIFMLEGQLITLIGTLSGIVVGVVLCLLQQHLGLIQLGTGDNFIVQSYPVSVEALDIMAILITALVVGYLATWYPVRHLTRT